MKKYFRINHCSNCGSDDLFIDYRIVNESDVPDGKLRVSDVSVIYFLGCNYCSETLDVVNSEQMMGLINREF